MCPTTIAFYPRKKVPQTLRSTSIFLNMMLTVNPSLTMFISNEIFVQTIGVIFCRAPSMRGTRNTGQAQERQREDDQQKRQSVKQVQVGYVMLGSGWPHASYEGQKK